MTLLTMIQDTCDLLSIVRPASVINSTDQQVRQLLAIANEEGEELSDAGDWQELTKVLSFITVAAQAQPAFIPADYDYWLNNTFWNQTTRRPLIGPITPQVWEALQANLAYASIYQNWRMIGNQVYMFPAPSAGQTIAREYQSINWCQSAGAVGQSRWLADTDTGILSESLMKSGIRWRWNAAKGFPYQEHKDLYEQKRDQMLARDGGYTTIAMVGMTDYPWGVNLPEGSINQ